MSKLIDIRIFGVPERMECIEKNKKLLKVPDDHVFIDAEHEGCVPTAIKAWSLETDKPYVMVLQDDVELCDGFLKICETMVKTHPDAILTLFPVQFIRGVPGSRVPQKSPYIETKALSAPGIIMKTEYVKPCLDFWDENVNGDDTNIQRWAEANGMLILTTIPPTLQHIGDISVFNPSRSPGRSPFYVQRPPKDVHWDCDYVTPWTNLIR